MLIKYDLNHNKVIFECDSQDEFDQLLENLSLRYTALKDKKHFRDLQALIIDIVNPVIGTKPVVTISLPGNTKCILSCTKLIALSLGDNVLIDEVCNFLAERVAEELDTLAEILIKKSSVAYQFVINVADENKEKLNYLSRQICELASQTPSFTMNEQGRYIQFVGNELFAEKLKDSLLLRTTYKDADKNASIIQRFFHTHQEQRNAKFVALITKALGLEQRGMQCKLEIFQDTNVLSFKLDNGFPLFSDMMTYCKSKLFKANVGYRSYDTPGSVIIDQVDAAYKAIKAYVEQVDNEHNAPVITPSM